MRFIKNLIISIIKYVIIKYVIIEIYKVIKILMNLLTHLLYN